MSRFSVSIQAVQHIKSFHVSVDLATHSLLCFVGRNGVGKTTLMRALRNLSNADTFMKTANAQIFGADSRIEYEVGEEKFSFSYDSKIRSLNCRQSIPSVIRNLVSAELPMPHGARFNYFRSASEADNEIRQSLIIANYTKPEELIRFLSSIYATDKYDQLVEVSARGKSYYCVLLAGDRYIREDHLSSGEYFLINLYRTIKSKARLIAVDEIDLSLDAAAQVQLAGWLRAFCSEYQCSILFTTHSLAMMRTLEKAELAYIDQEAERTVWYPASYSYVKARLFGFRGWDRYILTEDPVLKEFIEFVIQRYCPRTFFSCNVIYIGGASQVTDLLRRNHTERFLADPDSVIAILDGDQRETAHAQHPAVHCVPVESVEKAVLSNYSEADFPYKLPRPKVFTGAKDAFNSIQEQQVATRSELYSFLCQKYSVEELSRTLAQFLGVVDPSPRQERIA